jgi:hypothetical protein
MSGFLISPTVHTALVVGGFVAAITGIVGVFTVIRGQSFAGHALADLGAVGGSGAFLIGVSQVWGFVGAGVIAALLMELIGVQRLKGRDVATGVVFSFGLGLTALFLYWDTTIGGSSNAAVSVLFGSLFVIDPGVIPTVIALSVVALLLIGAAYRWLLMESIDHDLAAARGVPVRLTGILFLFALRRALVAHDRGDPVDRSAHRSRRDSAAAHPPLRLRRADLRRSRRRDHMGGHLGVIRKLLLGRARELAGELLHRRPDLPRLPRGAHRRPHPRSPERTTRQQHGRRV